ncbi:hypothetical protein [Microbacterium sp. 77mftsu3.1]|uniref:hypothetical protein n=1 Tax=Microbacterium sp. 77mftsu3.1 TaxID=1761802 RepID=UPI00037D4A56|nr:hypothetical protein [Microbacterium sp. 77mftsu3.1]SDH55199.1 hypothetical protein SAMN04488590_3554 [Microbacterium sp. 77mftsu3.1]
MTTSTENALLTFGDTFTLPATGDEVWTIKDTRPSFTHIRASWKHIAHAVNEELDHHAWYFPGVGWRARVGGSQDPAVIEAELAALNFNLAHRTAEEWQAKYRRLLATEVREDIAQIVNLVETWTTGPDLHIDQAPLRAHVAAVAACTVAGVEADPTSDPYVAVYAATITAYRSAL